MSKFSPIPLTKAKRNMILLRSSWADSMEYNQVFHQVVLAETLSYASMALAFGGQALAFLGAVTWKETYLQTALFASAIACTAGSIGTSVGATIATARAKSSFGKHRGSLGLNIGPQGIGAVYRLP